MHCPDVNIGVRGGHCSLVLTLASSVGKPTKNFCSASELYEISQDRFHSLAMINTKVYKLFPNIPNHAKCECLCFTTDMPVRIFILDIRLY